MVNQSVFNRSYIRDCMQLHASLPADLQDGAIVGAGPAGLTAGYLLAKHGIRPAILEQSGMVGGIARTELHKGNRFDIGGHRFYTKLPESLPFGTKSSPVISSACPACPAFITTENSANTPSSLGTISSTSAPA